MVDSSRRRYRKEQVMSKVLSFTIGLLIAGMSVAAAQAQSPPADRIIPQHGLEAVTSGVTLSGYQAKPVSPHGLEAVTSGVTLSGYPQSGPSRTPDTADAAFRAHHPELADRSDVVSRYMERGAGAESGVARVRPPDVSDQALAVQEHLTPTTIVVAKGGFDWGDAAIGLAAGLAIMLIVAGAIMIVRASDRRRLAV
jgi:hypothetical protein